MSTLTNQNNPFLRPKKDKYFYHVILIYCNYLRLREGLHASPSILLCKLFWFSTLIISTVRAIIKLYHCCLILTLCSRSSNGIFHKASKFSLSCCLKTLLLHANATRPSARPLLPWTFLTAWLLLPPPCSPFEELKHPTHLLSEQEYLPPHSFLHMLCFCTTLSAGFLHVVSTIFNLHQGGCAISRTGCDVSRQCPPSHLFPQLRGSFHHLHLHHLHERVCPCPHFCHDTQDPTSSSQDRCMTGYPCFPALVTSSPNHQALPIPALPCVHFNTFWQTSTLADGLHRWRILLRCSGLSMGVLVPEVYHACLDMHHMLDSIESIMALSHVEFFLHLGKAFHANGPRRSAGRLDGSQSVTSSGFWSSLSPHRSPVSVRYWTNPGCRLGAIVTSSRSFSWRSSTPPWGQLLAALLDSYAVLQGL